MTRRCHNVTLDWDVAVELMLHLDLIDNYGMCLLLKYYMTYDVESRADLRYYVDIIKRQVSLC